MPSPVTVAQSETVKHCASASRSRTGRCGNTRAESNRPSTVFRLTLVIGGEDVQTEFVAVGEVSPEPDVLDGLSLTYIGVVAGIALALAFGIQGLGTLGRIGVGLVAFIGVALVLKVDATRRVVLVFARWALEREP